MSNRASCERCLSILLIFFVSILTVSACHQYTESNRVPIEVQEVVMTIGDNIAQKRYEQIYNESSEVWKKEATLERSNEIFKNLREKPGKIESRTIHPAIEQEYTC